MLRAAIISLAVAMTASAAAATPSWPGRADMGHAGIRFAVINDWDDAHDRACPMTTVNFDGCTSAMFGVEQRFPNVRGVRETYRCWPNLGLAMAGADRREPISVEWYDKVIL